MAGIVFYTGEPRSGKSYNVVENVVIPALMSGRRVVTNLPVYIDKIYDYCVEDLGADRDNLGELIFVKHKEICQPGFFPVEAEEEGQDLPPSFVQPGDQCIFDEVTRIFRDPNGRKVLPLHVQVFFEMHGHFTHPVTGQSCDVALISQLADTLPDAVRGNLHQVFSMKRLDHAGMPNKYTITTYRGGQMLKRDIISVSKPFTYNPKIWALYKSFSQSDAETNKTSGTDKRGSIFNSFYFRWVLPFALIFGCISAYYLFKAFSPKKPDSDVPAASAPKDSKPQGGAASKPDTKDNDGVSEKWRLVGMYSFMDRQSFVLSDQSGRLRHIYNPKAAVMLGGFGINLQLPDGSFATFYSGSNGPATLTSGPAPMQPSQMGGRP